MKPPTKLRALLTLAAFSLMPLAGCAASRGGFDGVVSAVQHRYSVHAQGVPLMGFVSFCASVSTLGGVRGMRIAEFDNFNPSDGPRQLEQLIRDNVGPQWQPFVTDREADGEVSLIFARPDGDSPGGQSMSLLIADYDHGELDIVRMTVNGERLEHWMHDPANAAHHQANHSHDAE